MLKALWYKRVEGVLVDEKKSSDSESDEEDRPDVIDDLDNDDDDRL